MKKIHLNCDLGEGTGNDALLMPFISSCSIACGGHFGNVDSIKTAVRLAQQHGVHVGAHPSFEDRKNFGRQFMDVSCSRFRESVTQQIHLFIKTAQEEGSEMDHIKMHGALYHATAYRHDFSDWLVALMLEFYPEECLYVPSQSLLWEKCLENGISVKREVFADRRYTEQGELLPRTQKGALLTDLGELISQIDIMAYKGHVITHKGKKIQLDQDTMCIHGDNQAIVSQFERLIRKLNNASIEIV